MIVCFFNGHAPPTGVDMDDAVLTDGFTCRRCGKRKRWSDYSARVVVEAAIRRSAVVRERVERRAAA